MAWGLDHFTDASKMVGLSSVKPMVKCNAYLNHGDAMPVPSLNIDSITRRLNAAWGKGRFVTKDSLLWKSLDNDVAKIKRQDAAAGWLLQGMLESIAGDSEAVEYCFSNVLRMNASNETLLSMMTTYCALGHASKALEIYREIGKPENGLFQHSLRYAYLSGGFQTIAAFYREAVEKGLPVPRQSDILNDALLAAKVLEDRSVDDSQVARQLDIAGEVLRERHELFPQNTVLLVNGDIGWVTMLLGIQSDEEAYLDALIDKEIETDFEKTPVFEVVFKEVAA